MQVIVRLQSTSIKHEHSQVVEDDSVDEKLKNLRVPDTTPDFRRAGSNEQASTSGRLPQTVQDLQNVIASNCPVFYFHPEER